MFRNQIVITSLEEDLQDIGLLARPGKNKRKPLQEWMEEGEDEANTNPFAKHDDSDADSEEEPEDGDEDSEDPDADENGEDDESEPSGEEGDDESGEDDGGSPVGMTGGKLHSFGAIGHKGGESAGEAGPYGENFENDEGEEEPEEDDDENEFGNADKASHGLDFGNYGDEEDELDDPRTRSMGTPANRPPRKNYESKSMGRVNALLEDVQSIVSKIGATQRRDALKSFANISMTAESLARGFVRLARVLDEEDFRGVARTYRSLSEEAGKLAISLNEGANIRQLEETFKSYVKVLFEGIDLYNDILEACEEMEGEDEPCNQDSHVDKDKPHHHPHIDIHGDNDDDDSDSDEDQDAKDAEDSHDDDDMDESLDEMTDDEEAEAQSNLDRMRAKKDKEVENPLSTRIKDKVRSNAIDKRQSNHRADLYRGKNDLPSGPPRNKNYGESDEMDEAEDKDQVGGNFGSAFHKEPTPGNARMKKQSGAPNTMSHGSENYADRQSGKARPKNIAPSGPPKNKTYESAPTKKRVSDENLY